MAENSFWGLKLSKGLRFTKVAEQAFHVSAATLDPNASSNDIVSVVFEDGSQEFILCNLSRKSNILQVPLDLQFNEGETITFSLKGGKGDVFLTGYNIILDEDYEFIEDEEELQTSPLETRSSKGKRKRDEDKTKSEEKAKKLKVEESGAQLNVEKSEAQVASPNLKKRQKKKMKSLLKKSAESLKGEKIAKQNKEQPVNVQNKDDKTKTPQQESLKEAGKKKEKISKDASFSALFANGSLSEDDEEDEDFDEAKESEEESDNMEDEDDEAEEEEDEEEEDSFVDANDKTSPAKEVEPIVHSPGKTPMVKVIKRKANTPSEQKPKTPKQEIGTGTPKSQKKKKNKENVTTPATKLLIGTETPKSKKKNKTDRENVTTPTSASKPEVKTPSSEGKKKMMRKGGVICEELVAGTGEEATLGQMLGVYYEGRLKNGKLFDKTTSGTPFSFRLGANEVIRAWDIGVEGMRVGGKRRIIAPPKMAYGTEGAPPQIPPNSILTFEVELKAVK